MIIYDEIINNGSGLYIVFQKDDDGKVNSYLTRFIVPTEGALFTEWKKIFDGTIITYGLNFKTGNSAYNYLNPTADVDGEISTDDMPSMMEVIDWDKVVTVHYLDFQHAHLYAMIIEAGSTITVPVDPNVPAEDPPPTSYV